MALARRATPAIAAMTMMVICFSPELSNLAVLVHIRPVVVPLRIVRAVGSSSRLFSHRTVPRADVTMTRKQVSNWVYLSSSGS